MRTKRTIALIVGGCIVASLAVLAGLIAWLGVAKGIVVGLVIATVVIGGYILVIGPWQRRWGATDEEVQRRMPGDDLLRPDAPSTTRAITVDAPPEDVFRWLVQIGYGRGGWYSYDWIDNDGKPSVERIDPALQRLAVGDRIEMLPGLGPTVSEIAPDHHIVGRGENDSWCLLVEPTPVERTRLISRWRQDWPKSIGTSVWKALADPGAFVMEQRMLRRIRDLAEGVAPSRGRSTRIVVATFGVLAALAGVEHGVGEILQGSVAPEGLVVESWPDSRAMEVLQGEPALTVVPNLMIAGILTIPVAVAIGIWSVRSVGPRSGAIGLILLSVLLLLVGGGFGPPLVGIILGIGTWRIGSVGRRSPGRGARAIAPAWPWLTVAGAVGFLGLMPGSVLLSELGVDSAELVAGFTVLAFGGLLGALVAAHARDRIGADG